LCSVVLIGCGGGGDGVIQTSSDKKYYDSDYSDDKGSDDKGSKGSDDKGSKGSDDKGSKGSDDKGSKGSDDKGSKGSDDRDNYKPVTVLPDVYKVDAGRLLGSQCAQCHGTNGVSVNSWDSIAGEDNLHDEMFEYDEPIMFAQARGYTKEEISLIEEWLMTLKKYKD